MAKLGRRHYRAAQKEQVYRPAKGMFIPRARQPRLIAFFIGALALMFANGVLLGLAIGKK